VEDKLDIMGTDWVWYYSRNAVVINGKKYAVLEPVLRDELLKKAGGEYYGS